MVCTVRPHPLCRFHPSLRLLGSLILAFDFWSHIFVVWILGLELCVILYFGVSILGIIYSFLWEFEFLNSFRILELSIQQWWLLEGSTRWQGLLGLSCKLFQSSFCACLWLERERVNLICYVLTVICFLIENAG